MEISALVCVPLSVGFTIAHLELFQFPGGCHSLSTFPLVFPMLISFHTSDLGERILSEVFWSPIGGSIPILCALSHFVHLWFSNKPNNLILIFLDGEHFMRAETILFFFNLKTAVSSKYLTHTEHWFPDRDLTLEKTGVAPSPVERGPWPHSYTTLAPPYHILAQHCGCVPAGTRKCWNVGEFSDGDQGSGLCQGRWH